MDARNQNGDCDGDLTILSDKKDDCVLIEDDDGESDDSLPTTNSSWRSGIIPPGRKSEGGSTAAHMTAASINPIVTAALQQLNQSIVSSLDDDDDEDDIEEIVDDPLSLGGPTNLSISSRGGFQSTKGQKSLLLNDSGGVMNNGQREATNLNTAVPNENSNILGYASSGGQFNSRSLLNSPGVRTGAGAMLNQGAKAVGMLGKNAALTPVTSLLPTLTDDMFVLEAPSFVVPYIYEKPPAANLRAIVDELEVKIKEMRKKLAESGAVPPVSKQAEQQAAASSANLIKQEQESKGGKDDNDDDDDWDVLETSKEKTKVLIKEAKADLEAIEAHCIISPTDKDDLTGGGSGGDPKKSDNYFENPLGRFFMDIGINLVQEFVQTDLLQQQQKREDKSSPSTQLAINSLTKNLEQSKETNKPYKFEMKRCEYCPFMSESALVLAQHYETPHMRNLMYACNFCAYETRPPHDILYHMEAVHGIKGRIEKALSYHHCPNCPFEIDGKSKLARHTVACAKKFRPETNLNPPIDWEPPAKIVPRIKPKHGLVVTTTAYPAMTAQQQKNIALANQQRLNQQTVSSRPCAAGTAAALKNAVAMRTRTAAAMGGVGTGVGGGRAPAVANRNTLAGAGMNASSMKTTKTMAQAPSIPIMPLRAATNMSNIAGALSKFQAQGTGGKMTFVVCEICDGYIKDLDQLRNHMQWIHKVKIHPKLIYNRPPLNCPKCQYRCFTDQGLERHLLGSHALVTSSMQEAASKGKDAGRCPVCGRVFQWKLLNHVSREHNIKPAHLSYKCSICTATFGVYKQFESHVYSAHSTVAKRTGEGKGSKGGGSSSSGSGGGLRNDPFVNGGGDSLLKPLQINDEITLIPLPTSNSKMAKTIELESHAID